jgi:CRISPR/Cas system-associated exonuclease Cas4 (RecB family)
MGKETTRMLCEHARPRSEKLADFIKKKKMETGMYVHPVIKRSLEKRNEGSVQVQSRRASYTYSESELTMNEKDEDFNDPTFALSADTSTKLSIARSGTICAQDYYPSFLMAAESRYEVSTTRNTTDALDNTTRPPRDLSATSLRESMRNIYKESMERVHSEQKTEMSLSSRLSSIPKHARRRLSRSNPRGQKYAY